MKTRIDHATVVTCRGDAVVVLEDMSVAYKDGIILHVAPTVDVLAGPSTGPPLYMLSELRGRPLGRILTAMGKVTQQDIAQALDRQRLGQGAIGHILVVMGLVTDADIDWALAVQAGREPDAGPEVLPDEIINGHDRILVPGLVNTHHHLFQSLTRCMPAVQNATLFEWLTGLYPVWQEMDRDVLRQAAVISLAELILGGCTATSDHHYFFPRDRDLKLEAVLDAATLLGVRIHACRGSMSVGKSRGGLPPDACTEDEDAILADSARVIERFHDAGPMAMHRIDLAPCAPFSVSAELLEQTRALAGQHNVLLHTHAAETLDEERYCLDQFGVRPLEFLRRHGWLGPNVYLAHCVHLNDEEIRLLAETRTGVVHCPSSNMRLGSGAAPIRRMLDGGVRVGIGVDGSSSNDGGNLLAEARQALLLQRLCGGVRAMTAAEAFRLVTAGGADVLNRPELGRIEVGRAADLVLYDAADVALAGAVAQDPLGALMLCHAPRPRRVIVAGRTVYHDGHFAGIDAAKTAADFNQLVRTRFAGRTGAASPPEPLLEPDDRR